MAFATPEKVNRRLDFNHGDLEALFVELFLLPSTVLICGSYRPPSLKHEAYTHLDLSLSLALSKQYTNLLIFGEFNAHIDWTSHDDPLPRDRIGDVLLDVMTSAYLVQVRLEPTYSSRDSTSSFLNRGFVADPTLVTFCSTTPAHDTELLDKISQRDQGAHPISFPTINLRDYPLLLSYFFTVISKINPSPSPGPDSMASTFFCNRSPQLGRLRPNCLHPSALCSNAYLTVALCPRLGNVPCQLLDFLEWTTLFPAPSHGFRRDRGCDTALVTLNQIVSHNLDNRTETDLIQLDLSNAFDILKILALLDKYAYDTSILFLILCPTTSQNLQEYLIVIESWIVSNHLKLSPAKSSVMKFSSARLPAKPSYSMRGIPLPAEYWLKILGVTFTSTLDFSLQVASIVARSRRVFGFLSRAFKPRGPATFALLYASLVLPILKYGWAIWSPNQHHLIARIESVQRRTSRTLYARSVKYLAVDYPPEDSQVASSATTPCCNPNAPALSSTRRLPDGNTIIVSRRVNKRSGQPEPQHPRTKRHGSSSISASLREFLSLPMCVRAPPPRTKADSKRICSRYSRHLSNYS
ncbi:hypothetical protein MRX96_013887 [Rhipicephalus microplus]